MRIKRMEIRARIRPDVNRYLTILAKSQGISKNKLIERIINEYILEATE